MKPRILLDLDCVLADFVGGVARLWDITVPDLMEYWPAGEYGMNGPVARAAAAAHPRLAEVVGESLTDFQFWNAIESTPGFWADLPELPWCRELIDLVRSTTDDWFVVTSPSRCPRCIPEKRAWLHRVLGVPAGGWYDRMIPTPHKETMAVTKDGPAILIDDYRRNCEAFAAAGGLPILLPCHHNRLHAMATDPMPAVREALAAAVKLAG